MESIEPYCEAKGHLSPLSAAIGPTNGSPTSSWRAGPGYAPPATLGFDRRTKRMLWRIRIVTVPVFSFRRHRGRVPGRLHENPDRIQRLVRRSAVFVRLFVRSGLRVHQRHRARLLRVLHTAEPVRYAGQELQTRGRQKEPGRKSSTTPSLSVFAGNNIHFFIKQNTREPRKRYLFFPDHAVFVIVDGKLRQTHRLSTTIYRGDMYIHAIRGTRRFRRRAIYFFPGFSVIPFRQSAVCNVKENFPIQQF